MAEALVRRIGAPFKAFVNIQANPGAVIMLTSGNKTYTVTANSTTGIAAITVKKKAVYTITSNNGASLSAIGNTTSINVANKNTTYKAQLVKINGGTATSLANAVYSNNTLAIYWGSSGNSTAPSSAFNGYVVRYGASKPGSPTAGTQLYDGNGQALTINTSLTGWGTTHTGTANTTYYYRMYPYVTINGTKYYADVDYSTSGTCTTTSFTNKLISTTTTWYVPAGVRSIQYFLVGGGGGGGYGNKNAAYGGGGGGAGGYVTTGTITVTPGQSFSCVIGSGGAGATATGTAGTTGGTTKFGTYQALGGGGGTNGTNAAACSGGSGGTGGGGGGVANSNYAGNGGAGGSNGGNGTAGKLGNTTQSNQGKGDGKSKYAYGGTSGTLYAGGGGGGSDPYYSGSQYPSTTKASGGSGGGGAGGYNAATSSFVLPTSGTANTGSGGGGGVATYRSNVNGASGGSGVILLKSA